MVELAHGADLHEVRGTMRMDDGGVAFVDGENERHVLIPFGTIRRVRRVLGSPVLVVGWGDQDGSRDTAFYFVKPPPMRSKTAGSSSERVAPDGQRPSPTIPRERPKHRERRHNIGYLTASSKQTRATIQEWATEISARTRPDG